MKTRYRIVRDSILGYEVQIKKWYFPFWLQAGINTHLSIEKAEIYAEKHRNKVVKYID